MYDRFTKKAHEAMNRAREEADRFGHNYVGPEHILLGLIKEKQNMAVRTLINLGVNLNQLRAQLEAGIPKGTPNIYKQKVFTPEAKLALEYAFDTAREFAQEYIGTEHILLGLLSRPEGLAYHTLASFGVTFESARREITELLGLQSAGKAAPTTRRGMFRTSILEDFSRNLTQLAKEGKLDPIIGREKEIERVIQILCKRTKNNPVLVGEPGVGKTAIVEGLAQRIANMNVPPPLYNKSLLTLDLALLVAGTKYRGEFEERLKRIMHEIQRQKGEIILFIDEVHTLVGAGAAEGALDASAILKPALAKGELQCIGATTLNDYRKYIERDKALERRFQQVTVREPTIDETIEILTGLRERYETHHQVRITDEAIDAAAKLSARHITDRYLPDKAIDVIDEAAARVYLRHTALPEYLKEKHLQKEKLHKLKEKAILSHDYEQAILLREQEERVRKEIERLEEEWRAELEKEGKHLPEVLEEDITYVISSWTGIPISKLEEKETKRLLELEERLHKRVIGQNEAIEAVTRAIRRSRAGIADPKRPTGSFIFLGPTGVGKTELAKALAEALFDDEKYLLKFDMSEYMERFNVSRLIGAPPGYVGYEEGGQLTEKVRRNPYSVILFDEIEKAHPDVFNILLQIMEDGELTDSLGHKVNFRNTILIMTSNIGARLIDEQDTIGLRKIKEDEDEIDSESKSYKKMKTKIMDELKKVFRPEFLNRIDEIIVFHALTKPQLKQIVELMLNRVRAQVREQKRDIEFTEEVKELLLKEGYSKNLGARPLRRCIQKLIENPLSEEVLKGKFEENSVIVVDVHEGTIIFKSHPPVEATAEVVVT